MKNDKNLDAVERGNHFNQVDGHLIANKKDIKTIVIIILIMLIIIINVMMGLWFNNKLNRINSELYRKISNSIQTMNRENLENKKFNFGKLIIEQPDYDATTQYVFYSPSVLNAEDKTPKDENGIALKEYDSGLEYNPVIIAQYRLGTIWKLYRN